MTTATKSSNTNVLDTFVNAKTSLVEVDPGSIQLIPMLATDSKASSRMVDIYGQRMVLNPEAYKDFQQSIGLTENAKFKSNFTPGELEVLVEQALKGMSRQKQKLTIALDTQSAATITRVVKHDKKHKPIGRLQLVQFLEKAIGNYGKQVEGVSLSPCNTKAVINLVDTNLVKSDMLNEDIYTGRSLEWDLFQGLGVLGYVIREICTNGMKGRVLETLHSIDGSSTPEDWYNAVFNKNSAEKLSKQYFEQVQLNQQLNLSAREYYKFMQEFGQYSKDAEYITDCIGDGEWQNYYSNFHGIAPSEIKNSKILANMPTNVNRWDAINCLTWLASHDTKSNVSSLNKDLSKDFAGKQLFEKKPDSVNWGPMISNVDWNAVLN